MECYILMQFFDNNIQQMIDDKVFGIATEKYFKLFEFTPAEMW
jgi:hypothetical protein